MPVARGNANSLVKEFMAFQTLWESQKNDPKSDTVYCKQNIVSIFDREVVKFTLI